MLVWCFGFTTINKSHLNQTKLYDLLKRTEESFELDYIGCENWTILVTLGLFLRAAYEKNSVFIS